MKILGIDPGTTRIGYGLIEQGTSPQFIDCGLIEIEAKNQRERLRELDKRFTALLLETKPDIAGIETLFFAKNQKTALAVAEARGVLTLILQKSGVPCYECKPHEVKLAVCGYGLADKTSVAKMVWKTLRMQALRHHDDVTDALAIALTAGSRARLEARLKS